MKYRLYVSGFCNEARNLESNMGIGGVILNDKGDEKIFSEDIGRGTAIEAHIYSIMYGINEIIKDENISSLTVYSTNLMIINYLNKKSVEIPKRAEVLIEKLINYLDSLKFSIKYEYLEGNEYKYVRSLAEEALKV